MCIDGFAPLVGAGQVEGKRSIKNIYYDIDGDLDAAVRVRKNLKFTQDWLEADKTHSGA